MASKQNGTAGGETPGDKERDAYFDEQWAGAAEEDKRRDAVRQRSWLEWVKQNERTAPYSPWLVIPCHLTDFGQRPLPAGMVFWDSPFVWVDSPDPSGNPRAGVENFLVARVFNLGAATAAPTKVDFYWADPSVAINPATVHFVGTEWVEVQPMSSRVVKCTTPWIPVFVNNGHECAFAICSNHVLDPVLLPFLPWADRHVGQRNLAVLPALAQQFMFWAPLGVQEIAAELRVLAWRVIARDGFDRLENAHMTLANAAQEALRGARETEPQRVVAERIHYDSVLGGFKIVEERRVKEEPLSDRTKMSAKGADLGDVAMRLPAAAPGRQARIAVELREIDLAPNELIVVNIAHVAGGTVSGGYMLVLANPIWWKESASWGKESTNAREGGVMEGNESLESLVIHYNGQARVTHELARQLAEHLPIKSFEQLSERVREVTIGGKSVPLALVASAVPREIFPIEGADDLVRKLSAATRTAVFVASQPAGGVSGEAVRQLLAATQDEPGRSPSIPAGHFSGPSLFGSSTRKEA